jgi:hypothetical protein
MAVVRFLSMKHKAQGAIWDKIKVEVEGYAVIGQRFADDFAIWSWLELQT